jgi:YD repeat-containing protein
MLTRNRWLSTTIAVVLVFIGTSPYVGRAHAGTPSFVYDNGSRLLAAFDGNGNVANYQYDLVGNITAIVRSSASAIAVFGYSPDHGAAGTQVTIFGNNFCTTPTVKFGSASASVVSSTSTTILATAPTLVGGANAVSVTCSAVTATGPGFIQP